MLKPHTAKGKETLILSDFLRKFFEGALFRRNGKGRTVQARPFILPIMCVTSR